MKKIKNDSYNNKTIAIMGGTFDPVHLGHMSFARDVLKQTDAEEIVFMPAKLQPFKLDVKMSSFEDRYNMLQLACEALNSELKTTIRASVSSLENELEGVSYTYRTLEEFRLRYMQGGKLYFVTGADTFVKLDTWKEAERLLAENAFIVGVRPGYPDGEIYEKKTEYEDKYGTEVRVIMNTPVDLSATEIRSKAAAGEPLDGMVTDKVAKYIAEHRLYSLT